MANTFNDMDPDVAKMKPINTGLAQKQALKEQAEKNSLRELFNKQPSSISTPASSVKQLTETAPVIDPNFMAVPDIKTFNPEAIKPINTGLAEKQAAKAKADKEALAEIFRRKNSGIITEDAAPPDAGKEHEPEGLHWTPATPLMLAALYPKSSAVSDLWQMISAAVQQPGKGFALVAPHGTKLFIKADTAGALSMAQPDRKPETFANPTLGTDLDNDADDKDRHTAIAPAFETRGEVPEKAKDAVTKLINMADSIRKGHSPSPLNELPLKPKKSLHENKIKKVNLKEVNNLLFNIQDVLSYRTSPSLERLASDVSNVIAEALLSDNESIPVPTFEALKTKFNTLKRK